MERSASATAGAGRIQVSGGDTEAAIAHYKSAVALAPSAEMLNHVGVLFARVGQLDSAIDSFRAALRLDSGFAKPDQSLRQALALKAAR